jgi:hypothetical protein
MQCHVLQEEKALQDLRTRPLQQLPLHDDDPQTHVRDTPIPNLQRVPEVQKAVEEDDERNELAMHFVLADESDSDSARRAHPRMKRMREILRRATLM